MDSKSQQLPDGFAPYPENSPFLDRVGPLFLKMDGMKPIIGLYICKHHCNNKGTAHGGLMATLADISLGKTAGWSQEPRAPLVTTSLTIDHFGAARLHDWIVAEIVDSSDSQDTRAMFNVLVNFELNSRTAVEDHLIETSLKPECQATTATASSVYH